MTKFDPKLFDYGHGNERWVTYGGRFVGRFKYANPGQSARHFVAFLIANFTVEEYFAGLETQAPAKVLETKGYVCFNTQKAMKAEGVGTKAELLALRRAQFEARQAAL